MRSIILSLIILLVVFSTNAISEEPSLAETEKKISEQRVALKEKPDDIGLLIELGLSLTNRGSIYLKQAEDSKTKKDKNENWLKARKVFEESLTFLKKGEALADQALLNFPAAIDQKKEPALYKQRHSVHVHVLRVKLSIGSAIRFSARAYDPTITAEKTIREQKLRLAVKIYNKGYVRWRTRLVGLYFYYFEAECLVELNENKQAIQILQELVLRSDGFGPDDLMAKITLLFQKIKLTEKKYGSVISQGRKWGNFYEPGVSMSFSFLEGSTEESRQKAYEKKHFTKLAANINHNTFTAYTEILKKLKPDTESYAKKLAEQKQHAEALTEFDNEYKTEMKKFLKAQ